MKNQKKSTRYFYSLAILALVLSIPQITHASSVFTEVDDIISNILEFIQGPFAWFACVGSAAVALGGWALSDGGGNMVKTGSRIAIVIALLVNIGTIIGRVYSASMGLGF